MHSITRRDFLHYSAGAAGCLAVSAMPGRGAEDAKPAQAASRFKLGACDWSLGKAQNPEAFQVAREIGLDGVEVSFGAPGGEHDLRDAAARQKFQQAAQEHGLAFASLAMGLLNSIPYATDPRTEQWVSDVVDVMPQVGVKNCLLAFFGNGDLVGQRDKQDEVIRRLKRVAPRAEKAGVVLGIESWLNVDDHLRIVEAVGSPAVKVYYDVANMTERGYPVVQEMRRLGKDLICQIHMKENGQLLGKGKVDFARVKDAILEIGYTGWLIIEGATVPGRTLVDCYRENAQFLRQLLA